MFLQMVLLTSAIPKLFTTHRANERSSFPMYIFNMLIQVCLTFKYATTAWLRALNVRFHLTNMQMPFQILQIVCCQFVTFPTFVCLALHVGILVRFKIAFVVVTTTAHWTYIHVFFLDVPGYTHLVGLFTQKIYCSLCKCRDKAHLCVHIAHVLTDFVDDCKL